jgi:hypothetical protein
MPKMTVDTTQEKVKEFANKLATDDAFRAQMMKDPEGTLAPFGIHVPPGHSTGLSSSHRRRISMRP